MLDEGDFAAKTGLPHAACVPHACLLHAACMLGSGRLHDSVLPETYHLRAGRHRYDEVMEALLEHTESPAHIARFFGEAVLETLWPTRCAVCDEPGELLCDACRARLPYIDWWRACPRCGAPFGRVQCCGCNPVVLETQARTTWPLAGTASALTLTIEARRIVSAYKDQGERRLSHTMARIMARYADPAWIAAAPAITFVPATARARRTRGFDHAELLARDVACELEVPSIEAFLRPHSADQRALTRRERVENMAGSVRVLPGATLPPSVIVIDDVCTTGSTLCAAADALHAAGARDVYGLTFARAW